MPSDAHQQDAHGALGFEDTGIDRRTVLGGASAAALGISSLLLPRAAAAVSPGGAGTGTFTQTAALTSATLGTASTQVLRSFSWGTSRFFCTRDTDGMLKDLIEFSATGARLQTIPIPTPPTRSLDENRITPFIVVGDAAYAAFTQTISSVPYLRVMKLALSTSSETGPTSVTTSYLDVNLSSAGLGLWGVRTFGGASYTGVTSGNIGDPVSALVDRGDGALHCLMNNRGVDALDSNFHFLDHIRIPLDGSAPTTMNLAAGAAESEFDDPGPERDIGWPIQSSIHHAVAVQSASPTHAIFFDLRMYESGSALLVDLSASPVSSEIIDVEFASDAFNPTISSVTSFDVYSRDRSIVRVGSDLWVGAGTLNSSAAAVRFDLSTVVASKKLRATAGVLIPGSSDGKGLPSVATDGTFLYLVFEPSNSNWSVAKVQFATPSWLGSAPLGVSPFPAIDPFTIQATTTGALVGGSSATAPIAAVGVAQ